MARTAAARAAHHDVQLLAVRAVPSRRPGTVGAAAAPLGLAPLAVKSAAVAAAAAACEGRFGRISGPPSSSCRSPQAALKFARGAIDVYAI